MTTYRALVVEDEPVAAEANAAYLRRLDVEVVAVAASGQEASAIWQAIQMLI